MNVQASTLTARLNDSAPKAPSRTSPNSWSDGRKALRARVSDRSGRWPRASSRTDGDIATPLIGDALGWVVAPGSWGRRMTVKRSGMWPRRLRPTAINAAVASSATKVTATIA